MPRLAPDDADRRYLRRLFLLLLAVALGWFVVRIADLLLPMSINNNDTFKIFNAKNELLVEEPWLSKPHHKRRQVS